jgi:hypothetical protein
MKRIVSLWNGSTFPVLFGSSFGTEFPKGSVVIDPWRYLGRKQGVEIVPVGVGEYNGHANVDAVAHEHGESDPAPKYMVQP